MNPKELAKLARSLLQNMGGFTLDLSGNSVDANFWAVSLPNKEGKCLGIPSNVSIERFLQSPIEDGTFFGGWMENGVCFLDRTELVSRKESALIIGKENEQKAIFNLKSGELVYV